ncbi:HEPN domain-containing protein, partial [Vibrio anguillarum]|uniref:HEPN domain-containing protein n=2 Tax=Vibrionaceae TaxID=641 RepID=UPI00188C7C54
SRHRGHDKYRSRITYLFKLFNEDEYSSPETQANNAKYLAVLVSGYLEQSIKELLLHYAFQGSRPQVARYVEETWPISRNMNADNIKTILHQFNSVWSDEFSTWLEEDASRKSHINS